MDDDQNNNKNNLNIKNNVNSMNFNQPQNKFNINDNNALNYQSLNNNQFMDRYAQNYNNLNNINNNYYYNNPDIRQFYNQNQIFNINNDHFSNNNNYSSNDKLNQLNEFNIKNKNASKRTNYLPKNNFKNKTSQNENHPNQFYPSSYPNMPFNDPNLNIMSNQENNFGYQLNNNYSQDNENDKNFRNIITEINGKNNINKEITSDKVFKVFTHVFNDKMEDVAEVLMDEHLFKIACPSDIINIIEYPKKDQNQNKEFFMRLVWKNFYNVKLVIYNLYRTKTSIGYSLKSIEMKPVNIGSLEINFKYYYNTCQNKTLFISEFIMNKGILSEVFKEELFDNDLKILCLGCEKILRERKKEKSHISSMIINASKEKTWNSITDLNKKRYINYLNRYDLYYMCKDEIKRLHKGDNKNLKNESKEDYNDYQHIQKGDFIVIKKSPNEIFSKLIIDGISEEKDKNELILVCNKTEKQPQMENKINNEENKEKNIKDENIEVLNQKIILSVKEITKDICFLEFKHIWKDWVNINKINTLDLLKINSLKIFEQKLMKNNNEPDNKCNKPDNSVISLFNLLCPIEL